MLGWDPYQAESWFDHEDLSRGLEPIPVRVSRSDFAMMPFRYMSTSMVHEKAYVSQGLSHFVRDNIVIVGVGTV